MTISTTDFKNGVTFSGGGNGDTVTFKLLGGKYGIGANATWSTGTLDLKVLMPDASTYVAAITQITADKYTTQDLPPGTYQFVIATASAVQGFCVPIPYRQA